MKKSFQYVLAVAAAAVAAFSLSACGDDVTEVNENSYMAVLESGKKLSKQPCSSTNVGELLFVKDSSATFVCDGDGWASLKGKDGNPGEDGNDGSSCTVKQIEKNKRTGYVLTCGKNVVDTLWNGTDGKDGSDGTSCTAKSVKNKAGLEGLEVTCGGAVVDTIWNGAKGDKGSKGDSGAGCEIVKDSAGVVTLACGEDETADTTTLFKATCGSIAFDPATQYCSEGVVQKYGYITDDRDGQIYKTVKIGDQVWMAENLNYDPNYLPKGAKDSVILSRCYLNYAKYCEKYGRLYTWAAAMDSVAAFSNDGKGCGYEAECEPEGNVRGICPEGWHLPSYDEWDALRTAVGGSEVAGKMLKSSSGWNDDDGSSGNGSDAYGFSALPAGYWGGNRGGYGFSGNGLVAGFYSASLDEDDSYTIYCMRLHNYEEYAFLASHCGTRELYSVRCLQN